MTPEDCAKIIAKLKEYEKMTPEEARAYLVRLGTHDEDGNLTPEYGGEVIA